jgi:hypothetical protein
MDQESAIGEKVDFFVSYARADEEHAEWIAWELEEAGYTTVIQAWDFVAGSHFVHQMHQAAQKASRTVAVLSNAYLDSAYAEAEWQAAWVDDPLGEQRKLLVVRVEDCDRPGLLGPLATVDIFSLTPTEARGELLKAARGRRRKPANAPAFRRRSPDQALNLHTVADQLAVAVRRQWEDEAATRRLNEPYPLPVSWVPADPELVDDWETIIRLATTGAGWPRSGDWATSPAELAGSGRQLADVLDRVPAGRLLVLGEPGSGKSMLAVRLVLDLLRDRSPGGPVPVLVALASWNPAEAGLYAWLAQQLALNYPGLREPVTDRSEGSRTQALLDAGMILLLLDGLDEIGDSVRPHAISRINDALRPGQKLVLLSRTVQYREAARPGAGLEVMLSGAAGVALRPLRAADVVDYLQRSSGGPGSARRWEPIRDALTTATPAPVVEALTTPLMAGLARTIYNPRPGESPLTAGHPPAELLDPIRFPTTTAVEQYLFDGFIPAAYRPHPDLVKRCRWTAIDAERWLVFLARHLENNLNGTLDLGWWQLPSAVSSRQPDVPRLLVGYAVGLAVGLTCGGAVVFVGRLIDGLIFGAIFGLLSGLALGFASMVRMAKAWGVREPARRARWNPNRAFSSFVGASEAARLIRGLGGLLALALAGISEHLFASVIVMGLAFYSTVIAATAVLFGVESSPVDLTRSVSPYSVFTQDRNSFKAIVLATWIPIGFGVGLILIRNGEFMIGVVLAVSFGLAGAFAIALSETAWGMFVLARIWLAARGRLPWNLMVFLVDAHEKRGVLRQIGAVYQFRHIELQRRLANREQ